MFKVKIKTKIHRDIEKGLKQGYLIGLKAAVEATQEKVKEFAPEDTGVLKMSIGGRIRKNIGIVFSRLSYAIFQEQGTVNMSAARNGKGYFKPAAQFMRARIGQIFSKAIRASLRRS